MTTSSPGLPAWELASPQRRLGLLFWAINKGHNEGGNEGESDILTTQSLAVGLGWKRATLVGCQFMHFERQAAVGIATVSMCETS
jgi:hypothetical protein